MLIFPKSNVMNILIAISNSYVPYAAVMLQSLTDSNPNLTFDVYAICPDITRENIQKLNTQFSKNGYNDRIRIFFPHINEQIHKDIERMSPHMVKSLNTAYILRLYAPHILPENIQQILYLDVDTIISSSLEEIAAMQLDEDTALAAVKDLVREDDYERLGLDKQKHIYFNSGVMLLNLVYWRKHNIGDTCLNLLVKYSHLYRMPDQDALNVACSGHIYYLHPRYNCLLFFFARREFLKARTREEEYDNIVQAAKSPAIIHYVFVNKPWNKGGEIPKRELWLETLAKTEYRDLPITYKGGIKGQFKHFLRTLASYTLPIIGLNLKSDIFKKRRYKHIELFALFLYYGFAYWLPNFDSRFFGKLSNSMRVWCVRNIFAYVGNGVNIGRKARFGNGRHIWIGSRSNIGANCIIPANIVIGNDVMMGPNNFFFGGFTHNISDVNKPMIEQGFRFIDGKPEIGDDVWIGRECLFMPCIKIGSHSVVGARSVVTKNIPERVIVGGNPAKIIKQRI